MNNLFLLAKRNLKEMLRDPLTMVFCLGFPLLMLIALPLIFSGMEVVPEIFKIENYAVGICVFGYCFSALFVALTISGDKNSEFINRIKMSPIKKGIYPLSFVVALLPITILQTLIFFILSLIVKMPFGANLFIATAYLIPSAIFYISAGVLVGVICKTEKHAGPISSIIISLGCMLGGVFMPTENMGVFTTITNLLPFVHTVDIARGVFFGNYACIYPHILWVIGYTAILWIIIAIINKVRK